MDQISQESIRTTLNSRLKELFLHNESLKDLENRINKDREDTSNTYGDDIDRYLENRMKTLTDFSSNYHALKETITKVQQQIE
jgi:hypothetical protein